MNLAAKRPSASIALAYAAVAIFELRGIFKGAIGFAYDWGYPLLGGKGNELFSLWDQANGGGVDLYRTTFYVDLANYLAARAGLDNVVFYKAASLIFLFLAGLSGYLLARRVGRVSRPAAFLAGLFYQTSLVFIIRFAAGYFGYLVSGAFFPVLLWVLVEFVRLRGDRPRAAGLLAVGTLVSLLAFCQIHFIAFYVLLLMAGLTVAVATRSAAGWRLAAGGLAVAIGYGLANAFWFVTSFTKAEAALNATGFTTMSFATRVAALPHSLANTLLLSDHGITEGMMAALNRQPLHTGLCLLLVVGAAYGGWAWRAARPYLLVLGLAALAVLPLTVGATPPFQQAYLKAFDHIPGVQAFRETYHFEYVLLLCYAGFLAAAVEWGVRRWKGRPRLVFLTAVFLLILNFNWVSFQGDLGGHLAVARVPEAVSKTTDEALNALGGGRIFYPPGLGFWKLNATTPVGANYPDQTANSFTKLSVNQSSSDLDSRTGSWGLRNAASEAFMTKGAAFPALVGYLGADTVALRSFVTSYYYQSVNLQSRSPELVATWVNEPLSAKIAAYPALQATRIQAGPGLDAYAVPGAPGLVYAASKVADICSYGQLGRGEDAFVVSEGRSQCEGEGSQAGNAFSNVFRFNSLPDLSHTADLGWSPGYLAFYETPDFANETGDFIYTRTASTTVGTVAADTAAVRYYRSPGGGALSLNGTTFSTKGPAAWVTAPFSLRAGARLEIRSLSGENAFAGAGSFLPLQPSGLDVTPRHLVVRQETPYRFSLDVAPATGTGLIILSENYNSGWHLEWAGGSASPRLINGYANGFLLPEGVSGPMKLVFEPQVRYGQVMAGSLAFVAALAVAALLLMVRPRRKKMVD